LRGHVFPQSTLAALDILRAGGNAADAAVAASAVLCITEPPMTGIGGDCFALIGQADGTVTGLNGSGRASRHATADWLKASGLSEIATDNIHAVTVPGAVDGWQALLDKHGSMSLGEVLQPAIKLARDGCPVGPRTAHDWAGLEEFIGQDEGGRMHYLPGGKAPAAGQVIAYPALAKTLETIAGPAGTVSTTVRLPKTSSRHCRPRAAFSTWKTWPRRSRPGSRPSRRCSAARKFWRYRRTAPAWWRWWR
jgi:gamma-glutamyltranspeptidase/glutathione hydrolase